jgi:hypothetical protein
LEAVRGKSDDDDDDDDDAVIILGGEDVLIGHEKSVYVCLVQLQHF